MTGYTRKYALTLLKDPPPDEPAVKRTRRRRSPSYGTAEVELLRLCWLVTDGICSKRLAPSGASAYGGTADGQSASSTVFTVIIDPKGTPAVGQSTPEQQPGPTEAVAPPPATPQPAPSESVLPPAATPEPAAALTPSDSP